MIRLAEQDDREAVKELWEICFPDEGGFNPWFFEHVFKPEDTLLYEEKGELCAMLQMMPRQLQVQTKVYPVTYIYGACTSPKFRKKRLMAQLLQYSFDLDKLAGCFASVLIPQENWLFEFYKKFGYEPAFTIENRVFSLSSGVLSGRIKPCKPCDIGILDEIYHRNSVVSIVRNTEEWQQQLNLFQTLGEGCFCLEQDGMITGYCFLWRLDDQIWAQEAFAINNESFASMTQQIMREKQVSQIKITGNGEHIPFGCAKIYNGSTIKNAYMNLMFN